MSDFATKTYNELMALTQKDDAFFSKNFEMDGVPYRLFNYRLASWTSFLEPSALNCRGIMFNISNPETPVLVSLPPEKFFNYEEGGVDHTAGRFGDKMVKMDGSLISTYLHNDQLYLKSKASLFSSQALDAMKFLEKDEAFKDEMLKLVKEGYTVNLEYTSPENRIVIPYQTEDLTILSARSHETGENIFATRLKKILEAAGGYDNMLKHMVDYESLHTQEINHVQFMEAIRAEQEGEGYVMEIVRPDGSAYLVKGKNLKYVALHQTKDSVNSPKKLFEAIIMEASDDLRSMFADDAYVLNKIAEMEQYVQPIYNNIIKNVEAFHETNKELTRKDYAILAKNEHPEIMSLLMNTYLGQPNDYKEFAIKRRKELFGIGDEEIVLDDDGNVVGRNTRMVMKA